MRIDLLRRYGWFIGLTAVALAYFPRFIHDQDVLYVNAAECLLNQHALPQCAATFTYPPAFALLMIPLAQLPTWARLIAWYLVTWGALALVWRCSEHLARRLCPGIWTEQEVVIFRIASVLLSLKFILAVFENKSYDLLALAFIVAGVLAVVNRCATLGAVGLALAAAIKATPLIFLPWLLIKRHYLAAIVFALTFGICSLLPDLLFPPHGAAEGHLATWLRNIAGPALRHEVNTTNSFFWGGPHVGNQSLRGLIARSIDELVHPTLFKVVVYTAWLSFAAVLGGLLVRSRNRESYAGVDASLLLIGMLMLSPMTSRSHYVVLLLPVMLLSAVAIRNHAARSITIAVLSVSFVLTTGSSNDIVGPRVSNWSYFYGLMPLGALVLMAGLAVLMLSGNRVLYEAPADTPHKEAAT